MNKREFIKSSALGALGILFSSSFLKGFPKDRRLRTAHIGVGGMGRADLDAISSHASVDIFALCDVDALNLAEAHRLHPQAHTFSDYRKMLAELGDQIDAVIVSTPDHTHAPASLMAMQMNKPVYCQKPLTHYVSESREMKKIAAEKKLVTQMGIQVHSFYDYKLATHLIQSGIIGKVHTVHAWSPKNHGYDGPPPVGEDPVPDHLDWNLWAGTSPKRPYKEGVYHPGRWRQLMDYGCGTLGDMGVHIFDTPYNALKLDVPRTIINECRPTNGFGFPEHNKVTYEFPGTEYTGKTLKWIWYDGPGAPEMNEDLMLPNMQVVKTAERKQDDPGVLSLDPKIAGENQLPEQGAMFVGTKGRLLLPHFMQLPKKIVKGQYVDISKEIEQISKKFNLGEPVRDYDKEGAKHYHEFVDACLGKAECSAPFDYASRLTETILLGTIAGRFPGETLHWDAKKAKFKEEKANQYLQGNYRTF